MTKFFTMLHNLGGLVKTVRVENNVEKLAFDCCFEQKADSLKILFAPKSDDAGPRSARKELRQKLG